MAATLWQLQFLDNNIQTRLKQIQGVADESGRSFGQAQVQLGKLGEAGNKSSASLHNLTKELQRLRDLRDAAFNTKEIEEYNRAIQRVENRMQGLQSAGLQKQAGIGNLAAVPGLAGLAGAIASPVGLAATGLVGLGAAAGSATKDYLDFEKGLAKANVTAQLSQGELKALGQRMLDMAKDSTSNLNEVPDAFNRIISGIGDVALSEKILETSLKGAEAGFTGVTDVGMATVNILNAMGKAAYEPSRVMDIMFATLNKGNAEFADIANYLPQIVPQANALGISLEDTAAQYAFMTAQGLNAMQSATALKNLYKSLGDTETVEGSKMKLGFKGIGVSIFDATGKLRSMVDIAGDLNKSLLGLTDKQRLNKLDAIGLDMESSLALNIISQNVEKLQGFQAFTLNSQGALNKALSDSANTLNEWAKFMNHISVGLVNFGNTIAGPLNAGLALLSNTFKSSAEKLQDQGKAFQQLDGQLAPLLAKYDQLKAKSSLNTTEQAELKRVIEEIGSALPSSISAFDEYGRALDIARGKVQQLREAEADRLADSRAQRQEDIAQRLEELKAKMEKGQTLINNLKGSTDEGDLRLVAMSRETLAAQGAERASLMAEQMKVLGAQMGIKQAPGEFVIRGASDDITEGLTKASAMPISPLGKDKKSRRAISDIKEGLEGVVGNSQPRTINLNIQKVIGELSFNTQNFEKSKELMIDEVQKALVTILADSAIQN